MQENFTQNDPEKRKGALSSLLSEAANAGLVATDGVDRLADFLAGHGVVTTVSARAPTPVENGLSTLLDATPAASVEESEAPRFVRGFHDILISVGLIVGLGGLWGLAGMRGVGAGLLLIAAVMPLAEILVRRQRLALPAFVLTAFFSLAVLTGVGSLLCNSLDAKNIIWQFVGTLAVLAACLGLFYRRYRIPVAFAAFATCSYGTAVLAAFFFISRPDIYGGVLFREPWEGPLVHGGFGIMVFATALYFDLRDLERKTRRSDVAFWLFLVAAPVLVYAVDAIIFLGQFPYQWFGSDTTVLQTVASAATIVALMVIGILLDRRAFVTSGLLSLGYVFQILMSSGRFANALANDRKFFAILLLIGIVVLSLGIGWQALRRLLVNALPQSIQRRLPVIRQ